jgi:hypothetical protein
VSKWQKVFRYLWRINAILILVAAGAITLGVGALLVGEFGASSARTREAESGPLATGGTSDPRLFLGQASVVPGSSFMRADLLLHHDGGGFSSGGYADTRNVLFIDPGEKNARWLLPDDKSIIVESSDVMANDDQSKSRRTAIGRQAGGDCCYSRRPVRRSSRWQTASGRCTSPRCLASRSPCSTSATVNLWSRRSRPHRLPNCASRQWPSHRSSEAARSNKGMKLAKRGQLRSFAAYPRC